MPTSAIGWKAPSVLDYPNLRALCYLAPMNVPYTLQRRRLRLRLHGALAALGLVSACSLSFAKGFFDQGFANTPVVRTDYANANAGTAASPLSISACHFTKAPCPTLHSVFAQSNFWSLNWPENCLPGICPNFWLLTMNDEIADSLSNSGPPDASLPHAWPGFGIMGFNALYGDDNFAGDTNWRAHLVLNLYFADPQFGGNPFLAIGAFHDHGNGGYLGALNPSSAATPSVLEFDARLWGSTLPTPVAVTQDATIVFWLQVFAEWGAHPKAIQIALFHQTSGTYLAQTTLASSPWEWRYTQSGYYPGAIFVSTRAEDLPVHCGFSLPALVLHQDVHYSLDLQRLFQCMSDHGLFVDDYGVNDPLPATKDIPITIVNWADEGTGVNGALWTDVHQMRMVTTPADPLFANGFE